MRYNNMATFFFGFILGIFIALIGCLGVFVSVITYDEYMYDDYIED